VDTHPLDNPIWTALTTTQVHWAQTSALARRFPAEIGPLAAFETSTREAYKSLREIFPPAKSPRFVSMRLPNCLRRGPS